ARRARTCSPRCWAPTRWRRSRRARSRRAPASACRSSCCARSIRGMRVSVRLFAVLRERAGSGSLELELGEGATVADVIEALRAEPALSGLEGLPLRVAVNREYAHDEQPVAAGDELAAIPPVSGGA